MNTVRQQIRKAEWRLGWLDRQTPFLKRSTILQERFEGDGTENRSQVSRPKKDPILFFMDDCGVGLSSERMRTGLTVKVGLAGPNQQ